MKSDTFFVSEMSDQTTTGPTGALRWNQLTGRLQQEWFTHGRRSGKPFAERIWQDVPFVMPDEGAEPKS